MIAALVSACAESGANYAPILDGEPSAAYSSDLHDCQTLAANQRQFDRQTAGSATLGAGIGALAGVADDDVSEAEGIAAGLVVGAL
ncbi:glycine zipper family protein, partial [Nioella aestuarii]|uniref:glycine zipper family protein n=1 Tax=Nioella aestuarii TaxID=1662864 RepID=UPI003D7FB988